MYPAGPHGDPEVAVRFVTLSSGHRVRVLERGAGPVVVLLHGWGASVYTFRRTMPALAAAGHRVVVLESLGHGLSDKPRDRAFYTLPRLAESAVEALGAIGVETFAVAGHSMGGGVALEIALTQPARVTHLGLLGAARVGRVRGLWLLRAISPLAGVPFMPRLVTRLLVRALLALVYGRGHSFTPRDVDEYWAPSQYGGYARAMLRLIRAFDWSLAPLAEMRRIRVPTLLLTATADFVITPGAAAEYARAIEGARLETLAGAGHLFPESEAERTNAVLLALLRRPSGVAARRNLATDAPT